MLVILISTTGGNQAVEASTDLVIESLYFTILEIIRQKELILKLKDNRITYVFFIVMFISNKHC